ncbi:hypothetical protein CBS63078_6361 [Aspergillus niger]|uniref:Calcineurin-like phosphoesterase domain-containing protein n=2 Tax=Aspergillus niger TaxID=5061 RepID=G3XVP6_ASPNA|nr:hypothetical protein ASPNIDRAFT_185829 [Aspergillus niger ATCC 1015]KAI2829139.1 hypothetical protein CBS133816_4676 [Aspergillus niger]KAI2893488.1 hypothetical protein CBS13152_4477 [Aspergillus niger]KAI2902029.1 hypothetical protein CBS63078_6361 [Aspergillus niger]KAI2964990.1 hypothetical protein CBS147323_6098 [Aspergillus niger]
MAFSAIVWTAALTLPVLFAQGKDSDRSKSPKIAPRMQPDSHNTTHWPTRPLPWGELNIIHTTDVHGWLEGHLNEVNYGADWGDLISFVTHMRNKADRLGVDLLVVDTGDIVTGNGLSDVSEPEGQVSNPIFRYLDYDLLTIGNNDLYNASVTERIQWDIADYYTERYLTSNVLVERDNKNISIGEKYRYFTTKHGLRIMAFGFTLQDFKAPRTVYVQGYENITNETWFEDAMKQPVDLYLLIGHADIGQSCKIKTRYRGDQNPLICMKDWFRQNKPEIPLQILGGHSHVRNFICYDSGSSGLESGRYSDTVGWLALSNVAPSDTWNGTKTLTDLPVPTRTCTPQNPTSSSSMEKTVHLDRRYLDFNRQTFAYHALGVTGPDVPVSFDTPTGQYVTKDIEGTRGEWNLTTELGCAPQSYYISSSPYNCPDNIYTLVRSALNATVNRNDGSARLIIFNTYGIRYDLYQGPFTVGDAFTVSSYADAFLYLADVPYKDAKTLECKLNDNKTSTCDYEEPREDCSLDGLGLATSLYADSSQQSVLTHHARDLYDNINPGHVTKDDFGDCSASTVDCGDDTLHIKRQEDYKHPYYLQVKGDIDENETETVDVVFTSDMQENILHFLNRSDTDVKDYMDPSFTTRDFLQVYAKTIWAVEGSCEIGP